MAYETFGLNRFPINNADLVSSGSRVATSLNAAYSHLVSGPAVVVRWRNFGTSGLSKAYLFTDATSGTRANITLRARIYTATTNQPTATLVATADTVTYPAADDQWIEIVFNTPATLTDGEAYMLVLDNTSAAPTTDFPQILTATNASYAPISMWYGRGFSTANGFTTAGTSQVEMPYVLEFASGFRLAQPFTGQSNTFTSNQLARGLVIANRFKNRQLLGGSCASNAVDVKLYRSDQLPNDTPILTYATSLVDRQTTSFRFPTPITLTGSTDWYLVETRSSNSTTPGAGNIEDYSSFSAMFDDLWTSALDIAYGVQDDGSNGWTLRKNMAPVAWFFLGDDVTSGGVPLIGAGGLVY